MRNLRRALLASGLGFAVSFIASCGGGAGLLSGDQANTLNNQLDQISAGLSAGHCRAARSAARGFVQQVSNLPSTVNVTLRQDLDAGANTVSPGAEHQVLHQPALVHATPGVVAVHYQRDSQLRPGEMPGEGAAFGQCRQGLTILDDDEVPGLSVL